MERGEGGLAEPNESGARYDRAATAQAKWKRRGTVISIGVEDTIPEPFAAGAGAITQAHAAVSRSTRDADREDPGSCPAGRQHPQPGLRDIRQPAPTDADIWQAGPSNACAVVPAPPQVRAYAGNSAMENTIASNSSIANRKR